MVKEYLLVAFLIGAVNTFFPGDLKVFAQQYWLQLATGGWGILGILLWSATRTRTASEILMSVIKNLEVNIKIGKDEVYWPKIIKAKPEEYGWHFKLSLPDGLWLADILKIQGEIEHALNAECEIYEKGGNINIKAMTHQLPDKINFKEEWLDDSTSREE